MCSENIEDDGSFYLEGPITRPKMGLEIWYAKIDRERPEFAGIRDRLRGVLDADEFDAIVAQKGLIHCRVQIFGKKAHGAYNWRGVNSIEAAARTIVRFKNHKFVFLRFLRSRSSNHRDLRRL